MSKEHTSKFKITYSDIIFFLLAVFIVVMATCFYKPIIVSGESMEYTLDDKDILIAERRAYDNTPPQRGDIIVLNDKTDNEERYIIKRVIGIPGDTVKTQGDTVYINGNKLEEEYLSVEISDIGETNTYKVKDGEVFVLGDNRPVSYDSRYFGTVSTDEIIGKTKYRVYPFNKMGNVCDESSLGDTFNSLEKK